MKMNKFFNYLPGKWFFNRKIINRLNPELSCLINGTSHFTPVTSYELQYYEHGEFKTLDGNSVKSTNSYFFVYNKNENKLEKYFSADHSKGKLFYQIGADNTGHHVCAQDRYAAKYIIESLTKFTLFYKTHGPRKNYISETCYTKILTQNT